jgi:hypothetical protein
LRESWSEARYILLNPPYSNIAPWVDKSIAEQVADPEKRIALLIPNAPETAAFGRVLDSGATVLEIVERVKFVDLSGLGRSYPARLPSALCIWGATEDEITMMRVALARNGYRTRLRGLG